MLCIKWRCSGALCFCHCKWPKDRNNKCWTNIIKALLLFFCMVHAGSLMFLFFLGCVKSISIHYFLMGFTVSIESIQAEGGLRRTWDIRPTSFLGRKIRLIEVTEKCLEYLMDADGWFDAFVFWLSCYPLVNSHIIMDNHNFWWENSFCHSISMAMFNGYVTNYQRVHRLEWETNHCSTWETENCRVDQHTLMAPNSSLHSQNKLVLVFVVVFGTIYTIAFVFTKLVLCVCTKYSFLSW